MFRDEECMNIIEHRNLSLQPDRHIYIYGKRSRNAYDK